MKRLFLSLMFALSAVTLYAQRTNPWSGPPPGMADAANIEFYPINETVPPMQSLGCTTPEYTIITRSPNPTNTTRLLDLRTYFGNEDTGCWQSAFSGAGLVGSPGITSTVLAAWGSIGSQATAYRDGAPADPQGTATFEMKFTAKFHGIWWVDANSQTDWYVVSPNFTERRIGVYVGAPRKIWQVQRYKFRVYYVQQDSLSLGAEKGLSGFQDPFLWNGSATATASVGRAESVMANGSFAPSWEPAVADFDHLASNDPRVKYQDLIFERRQLPGNSFYYYFISTTPLKLEGRNQKAVATARMTTTVVGGGGNDSPEAQQQQGGPTLLEPAWATAYAKERFQVFAVRAIQFDP